MSTAVIIRFGIALLVPLFGWAGYQWSIHRALQHARMNARLLAGRKIPARRSIVYFSSPDCVPCKTILKPALQRMQKEYSSGVEIVEINVYEKPEIAREWGVLSIPATFILDENGAPRKAFFRALTYEDLVDQINS